MRSSHKREILICAPKINVISLAFVENRCYNKSEMKQVVLLSGGVDSSVLLYRAARQGDEVVALTIDYGQIQRSEARASMQIARSCGVPHLVLSVRDAGLFLKSALTGYIEVPFGPQTVGTIHATYVPYRNAFLIILASMVAHSEEYDTVAIAIHARDRNYPDCTEKFVQAMQALLDCYNGTHLDAPFLHFAKHEIVRLGESYGVPWELTWSCYRSTDVHCFDCPSCFERIQAFQRAGVVDPLYVRSSESPSLV